MSSVTVTTNVSLNGHIGGLDVVEYDGGGNQINQSSQSLFDGWNSFTLSGFEEQNTGNSYAVNLYLLATNYTGSPYVYQVTVEAPNTGASVYVNVNDSWEKRPVYFHNGTSWQRANDLKYYDGSEWV